MHPRQRRGEGREKVSVFFKGKVVLIDAMISKSETFNTLESSNYCYVYKYIQGTLNRI